MARISFNKRQYMTFRHQGHKLRGVTYCYVGYSPDRNSKYSISEHKNDTEENKKISDD